jgi:hypothetical protein
MPKSNLAAPLQAWKTTLLVQLFGDQLIVPWLAGVIERIAGENSQTSSQNRFPINVTTRHYSACALLK